LSALYRQRELMLKPSLPRAPDWEADAARLAAFWWRSLCNALRQNAELAASAFGVRDRNLAEQLAELDPRHVDRLCTQMSAHLLRIDEQQVQDVLVAHSMNGLLMPDTQQPVWRDGEPGKGKRHSSWLSPLTDLRLCWLLVMREGLRDDLGRAVCLFGLVNRQLAIAISALSADGILRLARHLGTDFLTLREGAALDRLMQHLVDERGEADIRLAMMAQATTAFGRTALRGMR